jgi:hypothetical protein
MIDCTKRIDLKSAYESLAIAIFGDNMNMRPQCVIAPEVIAVSPLS